MTHGAKLCLISVKIKCKSKSLKEEPKTLGGGKAILKKLQNPEKKTVDFSPRYSKFSNLIMDLFFRRKMFSNKEISK